jgi:glucose-6-phosphate isomerase
VEFVLPLDSNKLGSRYKHMPQAHALAQAQALMSGQSATGDRLYQYHPGNKPSTMVLLDRLDARSLGMLLACYEHRVYTQSVIWGVNAFDQWGVELGKSCAKPLMTYLNERMSVSQLEADPSTCNLAERIKSTVETVDFE